MCRATALPAARQITSVFMPYLPTESHHHCESCFNGCLATWRDSVKAASAHRELGVPYPAVEGVAGPHIVTVRRLRRQLLHERPPQQLPPALRACGRRTAAGSLTLTCGCMQTLCAATWAHP